MMWVKVLAIREIRQARAIIWILPIVHFLLLGLNRINRWFTGDQEVIDFWLSNTHSMLEAYDYGSPESSSRMWLVIALFILALIQLGAERRNGVQELLFSLPYTRLQIFINKWLIGVGLLAGSLVINTGIDMIVMANTPVSQYFSFTFHINEVLYSFLVGTAMYTFALFIGAISGSIASQAVFSALVFILPIGTWELVSNLLRVHSILYRNQLYSTVNEVFNDYFNLLNLINPQYNLISLNHVIIMGLILLLTAWGGIRAYERNRVESNGKLLIFGLWERIVAVGFVVYFSMLSAAIASGMFMSSNELLVYYMGLVAGVFLGIFIIRRLTRLRLKI